VQPDADGVRVRLACRKLWQEKAVRAANVGQGKRYAERWCAARLFEGISLREAVARLTWQGDGEPSNLPEKRERTRAQAQQERRLLAAAQIPAGLRVGAPPDVAVGLRNYRGQGDA